MKEARNIAREKIVPRMAWTVALTVQSLRHIAPSPYIIFIIKIDEPTIMCM